ncbi:MAG: type II toxin-antitoxin system VapC family toxin [Candidatus Sphingomonas phytovorans]|nr:type II toxin-antitoxin system VapC family toxin [Sphingomonas sp.]WEK02602.1 MAG: type II toxin-antitoxin system VapC family toxin [Sphingomonas sp.]
MLLRLMTGDDAGQARVAESIVDEDFIVTATVLVETAWVLRSRYGWTRAMLVRGLRMVIDLPHAISVPDHAVWAIDRLEAGADFADMMHIASAAGATRFATFDHGIATKTGASSPISIETLA